MFDLLSRARRASAARPSAAVRRRSRTRCESRVPVAGCEALEPRLLLSATAPEPPGTPLLDVDGSAWDASSLLIRVDTHHGGGEIALAGLHAAWAAQPVREFTAAGGLQVVHLGAGVSVIDALAAYQAHPAVAYAEPNYRVSLSAAPDDPQFGSLWGMHNVGQTGGTPDADIDALEAWGVSTGSGSLIVAVIDTGVDHTHPDLAANMWVNAGEIAGDGIDNDGNGYVDDIHGYDFINDDGDPRDDHNHGTHVAGTIGAVGNNGLGVVGVNWNVQIMALKFLGADGSGSIADAIEAIDYAVANGARLSNNSWGFNGQFSQALYDAVAAAREAGHVFVAAAGNGNAFGLGQNNDSTPFWPANIALDNVVSVAAVDHRDQLAIFSNYGATTVDLAAPGVGILSTTRNGTYGFSSGTSMAAPHVTGALALLLDRHPEWTHTELIERLLDTVDPVPDLAGVTVTGGRLNVFEALIAGVTGPRVVAHAPSKTFDPLSAVRVTFSEAIDAATFTPEDVASFTGPLGPITVLGVEPVAGSEGREFDLLFAEQAEYGTYELVFGPEILDLAGELMDQDADGVQGEPLEDRYVATFVIEPFSAFFDFGTSTSPIEPGYVGVIPETTYTPERGYGWQAGAVLAANRSSGTALTSDLHFGSDMTFAIDVKESVYDVTLTMGDTGGYAHQDMAVFLEGVHVATISTAAGEIVTNTYQASVADGQLTVRLVDLGGSDPNAVLNGLAVRLAGPDVEGPRVVSAEASGPSGRTIDRVTLTFSEPIDESTFTLEDVDLSGPGGPIAAAAVSRLDEIRYEVVFAEQDAAGDYRLVVGPDIHDAAGNAMDQDGDGTAGEPLDDQFSTSFTIEPFAGAFFDFGTASSPVEAGYVAVDPADTYSTGSGFGWLNGNVLGASRSSGTALTRDLNFSSDATFVADVPDGMYDVTVMMGDTAGFAHDEMAVFLEGVHVATISTAATQVVTNTFQTSVADGQLTLRLVDLGGQDANAVINALEVRPAGPDVSGPRVVGSDPAGSVSGPVSRVLLDFSEAIQDGSFTLADVVALTGPAGPIVPSSVTRQTATQYEIAFPPQHELGDYTLIVGPDILDASGNSMDQDGDGTNGEPIEDRFQLTFTIEPFTAQFDFGTSSSPVEPGYIGIDPTDVWSAALGYGWQSGSVLSVNRSGGTALTRDLNFSSDATFAVAVADGLYDVTLTMGDTGGFAHDEMAVFLEDAHVATLNTAAGQVLTNTWRVSVGDGALTLRLVDLGGSDANAVINGLVVQFAGDDHTGPRVIAADPAGHVAGSLDHIRLTFDEPLRPGTFTLEDIVALDGPHGAIPATAVNPLSATTYEIVFDRQFAPGEYVLTVGPDIEDLAGNRMDQDGDGISGEIPDDRYTTSVTLESFLLQLDFGTATSPVEEGFLRVTHTTAYTAQSGYGWLSGTVRSADRTFGSSLTRDFNFTELATLVIDAPAGLYQVVLTMGDTGAFGHDQMGVFIEGIHVDTVSTAPREIVTRTYEVEIGDGQLTLLLDDLGGSDRNVVLNGLELMLLEAAGGASALAQAVDLPASLTAPARTMSPSTPASDVALAMRGGAVAQAGLDWQPFNRADAVEIMVLIAAANAPEWGIAPTGPLVEPDERWDDREPPVEATSPTRNGCASERPAECVAALTDAFGSSELIDSLLAAD